jgi:flagellin-like protein
MPIRKRAVSEVISSLILLMIVSVLGTYLYTYTLNSTGFQRNIIEGDIERKSERAQEKFSVTAVWYNNISDLMNLTILNFGRLDIKIAAIYINDERVTDY